VTTTSQLKSSPVYADVAGITGTEYSDTIDGHTCSRRLTLRRVHLGGIVHGLRSVGLGGVSHQTDLKRRLLRHPHVTVRRAPFAVVGVGRSTARHIVEHARVLGDFRISAVTFPDGERTIRVEVVVGNLVAADVAVRVIRVHLEAVSPVVLLVRLRPLDRVTRRIQIRVRHTMWRFS